MPEIVNTTYLLAALGIIVPILIHLWNRKPPWIVEVGSIRWLKGSSTQSARRLWPEQWPLLLLRCLLLLLFSLLLAGLWWETSSEEGRKGGLYLVHAQLLQNMGVEERDSLIAAGLEPRLLAPGLPSLEDSLRWKDRPVNIWAVLREADRRLEFSDTVRISSPLRQVHFGGERPELHKTYIFMEEGYQPGPRVLHTEAIRLEGALIRRQAFLTDDKISVRTDTVSDHEWQQSTAELKEPDSLKVSILAAEGYSRDALILQYAIEAAVSVDPSTRFLLNKQAEEVADSEVVFWLQDEQLPEQLLQESGKIIAVSTAVKGAENWLVQDYANPRQAIYYLSDRPLPEQVSREKLGRLPLELFSLLQDRQEDLSRFLPMPVAEALPLQAAAPATVEDREAERTDLHNYLWLVLFCLFVIERIWGYRS